MDSLRMQQIMVIAHHDPRFFDQLNAEPQQMALRLECSPLELQTIAALDPRLFRVDNLRGDRLLKGLLDRFTVSLWQVLSNDLFPQLRAFLSSDQFYRSVLRQAYVHQAFAAYLTASFPQLHHLVMLEMAIEDVASIDENASDVVGEIVLNPRVQLLKLPHGLLARYLEARKMITATALSGAEFLLAPGQSALESKRLIHRDETEWVLIEPSNPVQIGELNDALGQILNFVKKTRSKAELVTKLVEAGAELVECEGLLQQFHSEHWIVGQLFSPKP